MRFLLAFLLAFSLPVLADDHCDKPTTPTTTPVITQTPERHHGRHDYGWLVFGAAVVGVGLVWHFDHPHNVPAAEQQDPVQVHLQVQTQ